MIKMSTQGLRVLLFLAAYFAGGQAQQPDRSFQVGNPFAVELTQNYEKCKPCDGEVNASLSFDGLTCIQWLKYASEVTAHTEECALERILGWKFCGCSAQTEERCTFCDSGNAAILFDRRLPFSSITCEAFVDIPAIDGATSCNLAHGFATYCGCQSVSPQCTLCSDGAAPQNMDAPLYLGLTCSDIHDLYLVSSPNRCAELSMDYPFDLQAYCGCNNARRPEHGCIFCPYGGVLNNHTQELESDATSTCGDWASLAAYAKEGESSCAVFQYVGLECCDSMVLPDFFVNYFDNERQGKMQEAEKEQKHDSELESELQHLSETAPPFLELGYKREPIATGQPQAHIGQPDLALNGPSFMEVAPAIENISMAIRLCFARHTSSAATPEALASHLMFVENKTLIEKVPVALGGLFQYGSLPASNTTRAPIESGSSDASLLSRHHAPGELAPAIDLSSSLVAANKWDKLFQDLVDIDIPSNFMDMVPQEYTAYAFLGGLSGCLETAVNTFADCLLCPDGGKPTKGEKMIPITGLYCNELATWRLEAEGQDCLSLNEWLPFDMASWCGCPGIPSRAVLFPDTGSAIAPEKNASKCSFCPEGSILVLDSWEKSIDDKALLDGYKRESTCAEWDQMADFVTTEAGCSFLNRIAMAGCCEVVAGSILDHTPTLYPIVANMTVLEPAPTPLPVVHAVSVESGVLDSIAGTCNFVVVIGVSLALLLSS